MPARKPLRWVGDSRESLREFPAEVRREIGFALHFAQEGDMPPSSKPLKGFGDAAVVEIVESFYGQAFRLVYTVRFKGVIYVLHAFEKKSKSGVKTPQHEIDMVGAVCDWRNCTTRTTASQELANDKTHIASRNTREQRQCLR